MRTGCWFNEKDALFLVALCISLLICARCSDLFAGVVISQSARTKYMAGAKRVLKGSKDSNADDRFMPKGGAVVDQHRDDTAAVGASKKRRTLPVHRLE